MTIISYNNNSDIWSGNFFFIHDFQKGSELNKVTYINKMEKNTIKLQPMYDVKISKVYIWKLQNLKNF